MYRFQLNGFPYFTAARPLGSGVQKLPLSGE